MPVRGLKPQPEEALGRSIGQSPGLADRLFEMRDRLVVGGSPQRPVARLDPPFDGRFAEPPLREMMGDDLRLDLAIVWNRSRKVSAMRRCSICRRLLSRFS